MVDSDELLGADNNWPLPAGAIGPTLDEVITAVDSEFDRWTRGNDTLRR